jgi:hypothetical protein
MKVAILVSGQPRNFRKGYEELKNSYLSKYDCDIFYHTWDSDVFHATQFFPDRPAATYALDNDWKTTLSTVYTPRVSTVESPKIFDTNNHVDPMWRQPLQNTKSMFYSINRAYQSIDKDYDVYIRTRFDLRYEPATMSLESLDLNKLHVWDWDTDSRVKHRGYYDVFAIGNKDIMGIYCNTFTKLDWYLNYDQDYSIFLQGGWPGQDSKLRNEYLLRWHLTTSGVPVQVHPNTIPHADGHIIR